MKQKATAFALVLALLLSLPLSAAAADSNVIHPAPAVSVTVTGEEAEGRTMPLYLFISFSIPQSVQDLAMDDAYRVGYVIEYRIADGPWQLHNEDWEKRVDLTYSNSPTSVFFSLDIKGVQHETIGLTSTDFYREKELSAEHEKRLGELAAADDFDGFSVYLNTIDPFGFYKNWVYTFRVRFYSFLKVMGGSDYAVMQLSPYSGEVRVNGLGTFTAGGTSSNPDAFWTNASPWAADELKQAYKNNLIPASLIGVDLTQPVTRAEFAQVVMAVYGAIAENPQAYDYDSAPSPFSDVVLGETQGELEIISATRLGIVYGVGDGKFAPDLQLTRQELATMLFRCIQVSLPEERLSATPPSHFNDSEQIAAWAVDAVSYLSSKDIIRGSAGAFMPLHSCSREAALLLANRICHSY